MADGICFDLMHGTVVGIVWIQKNADLAAVK